MEPINFSSVSSALPLTNSAMSNKTAVADTQKNFASFLKESINNVNQAQNESDMLTNKLARGENVDLSQVMIASQKASITMQATLEIRNKAVEAYQEMMRMSV
ncbi:flagellar hook-basal body complex protein FliE [Bacillus circulans]|jgi:flagellar hook-basal body complex protein FliE|uniref:flagellar hook-basal body complex protein FliE n=1 Tax=Niallia circulans TaxID=1397 RepID=UPI00155FCFCF|nr:flagellar hook-basal body complex protein FliE [Niallia circulans]NRG29154.1 flagellar hook-basal body complex protein FliE [Niallia circulans]UQZ73542.1 flagellar hook-basal body complex protein FliE [Niallia circulans]